MSLVVGGSGNAASDARVYKWLAAAVVVTFVLLIGRLWQLQVMEGERFYSRTTNNIVKKNELPATRGELRDRRGRVLVDNRPSYNVHAKPRALTEQSLARLQRHLGLSDEQTAAVKKRAAAKRGQERDQPLLVAEDVGRDQMGAIESDAELAGVTVASVAHRRYPYGKLAAHALGYMNQVSADELVQMRDLGYRSGDYIGRMGLERQWESFLRGKDGFERLVVDAKGRVKTELESREVEALVGGVPRREPEPGRNVVLTLDIDLQRVVEKALARHHSAAAVVIEVDTGRVLAIASHPAFDPNVLTGHLTRAEDERLQQDPFRPLMDKVVRENYFPASTWKIIPALAALEDKTIGEHDKTICRGAYEMPGHTFRCMKSHGPVNLYDSLVQSCNLFFYHLGEKVGMDRMARLADEFGFGAPTGIGIQGEAPGFVPTQEFHRRQGGFRIGYTLNTAIGQGATKVTVLQMALAYAALANGGDLYVPQLVDRIEAPSGAVVQSFAPRLRRHLEVRQENLEVLRRALCGVVNDPRGTSFTARDPALPVEVCGKSGTAQLRKNRRGEVTGWDLGNDHAWFTAFAPARKPQVSIAVLVEHGGLGGHVAAPTGVAIMKGYFLQVVGEKKGAEASVSEQMAKEKKRP